MKRLAVQAFQRRVRGLIQHCGARLEPCAIDPVSQNGMSDMRQMHADLVGPAGLQTQFQKAHRHIAPHTWKGL